MLSKPWFTSMPPDQARRWFASRKADIDARRLMLDVAERVENHAGVMILLHAVDHLNTREEEARRPIQ
jgi:hypothetical protein